MHSRRERFLLLSLIVKPGIPRAVRIREQEEKHGMFRHYYSSKQQRVGCPKAEMRYTAEENTVRYPTNYHSGTNSYEYWRPALKTKDMILLFLFDAE